jgi:hypothetical protein
VRVDLDTIDGTRVRIAADVYARQEDDLERVMPLVRVPRGEAGIVRHAFMAHGVAVLVVLFAERRCIARVNAALADVACD